VCLLNCLYPLSTSTWKFYIRSTSTWKVYIRSTSTWKVYIRSTSTWKVYIRSTSTWKVYIRSNQEIREFFFICIHTFLGNQLRINCIHAFLVSVFLSACTYKRKNSRTDRIQHYETNHMTPRKVMNAQNYKYFVSKNF